VLGDHPDMRAGGKHGLLLDEGFAVDGAEADTLDAEAEASEVTREAGADYAHAGFVQVGRAGHEATREDVTTRALPS